MSSLDAFTSHLINQHEGRPCISVEEAGNVVGIDRKHAYRLIREDRFPAVGTSSATASRGSLTVFIPTLVAWMAAGGTRQYDADAHPWLPDAAPGRGAGDPTAAARARMRAGLAA